MAERKSIIALQNQAAGGDLTDPPQDQEKLQETESTVNIPEVKDIPGQENIRPPKIQEMADVTPSSDDEEGTGLLDKLNKPDDDDDLIVTGNETDISPEELSMLEGLDGFEATADNENLAKSALDNIDQTGEELNEDSFGEDLTGEDLDIETGDEEDLIDLDDQEEE